MNERERLATWAVRAGLVLTAGMLCITAWGQPVDRPSGTGTTAEDAEWRQQMERRVQAVEQENASLRKELGQTEATKQAVARDAESRGAGATRRPDVPPPPGAGTQKDAPPRNFPGSLTI